MSVRSFVRPVRPGMFRGTFQQYHDTESWYGIQYLDNGTIGRNGICGTFDNEPHSRRGGTPKNVSRRFLAPTLLLES